MLIRLQFLMAVLASFAVVARPALAEVSPSPTRLQTLEDALAQSERQQRELDERLDKLLQEEAEISGRLVAAARQLREAEDVAAAGSARVRMLQSEKAEIALDLASRQDVLSQVLAGLQRLEQNPPPALVVNPHDVLAALRSAMLFGTLAPELRQAARDLQNTLVSLGETEAKLSSEVTAQKSILAALVRSRAEMMRLAEEKHALARSLNLDLEAERKRTLALAQEAKTLRELLDRIAEQEAKTAARKAEKEARKLAMEARRGALAALPRTDFSEQKGKLGYPASGRIVKRFGEDTGLDRPLDGIVIATEPGATITSPASGLVEFAGPFRSYGEMVIVNPGKGYLILLTGLGHVTVSPGEPVHAGEPVATMGEKPVSMALSKDLTLATSPMLYVEFRKNGEPVDPTPWWAGLPQSATPNPVSENQGAMR